MAKALGYSVPKDAISRHCKGALKHRYPTEGGEQELKAIPEGDVYRLIIRSNLPTAEKFEKWVFDEILPSIRSNGGYIMGQETISDEELMARALLVAQNKIAEKQRQIEIMQPKADYFDALCDKNLLTNFRDTAKELHLKERDFIKWLESRKFIYHDKKGNIKPYAEYSTGSKPYFEIKEFQANNHVGTQTLITPRGREAFKLLTGKLLA